MRVWKYQIGPIGRSKIAIQKGAEILHVGMQRQSICLWARVDETAAEIMRIFEVIETGDAIPECDNTIKRVYYVGTVKVMDASMIYHVFDLGEIAE